MKPMNLLMFTVLLSFSLTGCGGEHDENGGHGEHGGGESVEVPDDYAHAVEKCEELSKEIDELIAEGHLDDVYGVANNIVKIAEKLPELAQKDLSPGMLKEVNIAAKSLAGMFSEIDNAADAGNKAETIAVHKKMKGLIADLAKHAEHGKE